MQAESGEAQAQASSASQAREALGPGASRDALVRESVLREACLVLSEAAASTPPPPQGVFGFVAMPMPAFALREWLAQARTPMHAVKKGGATYV